MRPEYYHQQNFYNNRTVAGSVGSVAHSPSPSNLLVNQSQASNSSSYSATRAANRQNNNVNRNVSYNDLCFPKASNCGSMKRKKQARSQGVDCQIKSSNNGGYGYINYLSSDSRAAQLVSNKIYE